MLWYVNFVLLYANGMQMEKVNVSIVLDKRYKKQNKKYPVKLRVYHTFMDKRGKQRMYATEFDYSESEFASIWETVKPRKEYKEQRQKLAALETKANKIKEKLKHFSFEVFESKLFNKVNTDYTNLFSVFNEIIKQKNDVGAVSTSEKYVSAQTSLKGYLQYKNKKVEVLPIEQITIPFLNNYSFYCENVRGLSSATIGIYIRNLRCVYRVAMNNGAIQPEYYPFGSDKFVIPTSKKINKALTEEELRILWNTKPQNEKQSFAKDFWFFSYFAYGMNTKDICELKHSSINGNSLFYIRAKTKHTKRERIPKEVPTTNSLRQIIERRQIVDSEYLFGILNEKQSPKQKHTKIRDFNKKIVTHFREFAKHSGINEQLANQLGTYHARHSFATISIKKGKSIALISEILHDGNLKVTQNYINSFPKDVFMELSNDLELN